MLLPELKTFEVVQAFLELTNRKEFLAYLNRWYSSKRQEKVEDMIHQAGKADTDVTPQLITFSKNAGAFAERDRECLDEYY